METSTPRGGGEEHQFIQQQGGHVTTTGGAAHTQDFIYLATGQYGFTTGQRSARALLGFQLSDLGSSIINRFVVYQTYKLNSIQESFYFNTARRVFTRQIPGVLTVTPWSRNYSDIQDRDPRQIPGAQIKYINVNKQISSAALDNGQQPQMVTCINEKPLFQIPSARSNFDNDGLTYANGPLTLQRDQVGDDTIWRGFITEFRQFEGAPESAIYRFNIIVRVNITLEGIQWLTTFPFPTIRPEPPSGYGVIKAGGEILGIDDLVPPSPFEQCDEMERSEAEVIRVPTNQSPLQGEMQRSESTSESTLAHASSDKENCEEIILRRPLAELMVPTSPATPEWWQLTGSPSELPQIPPKKRKTTC